ncbi:type 1 glutamine amidotransferase domain-containing protein [Streptomyces sp. NPDC051907]|uniref:type 1 glutamine amidotransferase domain-containing protein n=1 Tax=Streptomyces sp. NPDC051907 TaxID=3155284 RepID=UPI00341D0CA0
MRVAFLVAPQGAEQVELTEPWRAVGEADGERELISTRPGQIQAFDHLDRADRFPVDRTVAECEVEDFDGLVLPGGVANPDALRMDEGAVAFVRGFVDAGKPVAAICHAAWVLVEADRVRGRRLTSYPSVRTDVRNAGGEWVDEQVVVCDAAPSTLITSRRPADLKAFCAAIVKEFGG